MDVVSGKVGLHIGSHRLGFGNLLGFQALAFQHVFEVHVATNIELVGAVHGDTAGLKERRQCAVGDGCTNLGFDVVTNNGHLRVSKLLGPCWIRRDEHR